MKNKKRILAGAISMALMMSTMLVGCSSSSSTTTSTTSTASTSSSSTTTTTATTAEAGETYEFSLAHHHAVDSITDNMCNAFAELVYEKTNGAVKITVYPSAQMGGETEVGDGLLMGTQQFGSVTAGGVYVDAVPGFGADTLPFMFSDWDEINYVFNETEYGDALNEKLIENGARVLSWAPCGGRHMIFVDKEVTSYKQISGMTMRSPESTLYTSMFEALGAAPTPVTWSECYTAMQTKVAEGMESPVSSILDMNFCEVTDYCLMTNHMWSTTTIIVNEALYQTLPEEYQLAIDEAGYEAGQLGFQEARDSEAEDMAACEEKGLTFIELPEGESEELSDLMMGMKEAWLEGNPDRQEMFDLCVAGIAEYAALQ